MALCKPYTVLSLSLAWGGAAQMRVTGVALQARRGEEQPACCEQAGMAEMPCCATAKHSNPALPAELPAGGAHLCRRRSTGRSRLQGRGMECTAMVGRAAHTGICAPRQQQATPARWRNPPPSTRSPWAQQE